MTRGIAWGGLASVLLAGFAVLAVAPPAAADIVDDGAPGLLTIDAEPRELQLELDPGEHGEWLFTVRLDAPTSGQLDLRITSSGVLVSDRAGLQLGVQECSVPWLPSAPGGDASCPGTTSVLLAMTPFLDIAPTRIIGLGTLAADRERYLRATIAFPDPAPGELQGGDARFALGFAAAGDLEVVDGSGPRGDIAQTGVALVIPLALAALLAALGVVLRVVAPRERRETSEG